MRCLLIVPMILMLLLIPIGVSATEADDGLEASVKALLASEGDTLAPLLKQWRERGPTGLRELVNARDGRLFQQQRRSTSGEEFDRLQAEIVKLNAAIDEVGGAKYCSASKLYWYTDLRAAQAEAERTNKPILALRMLGNLNEEFSCANSRFFRTTLYANQEISQILRDKFVLHWGSVRPVPKVTIDFGDGRKLERTLTGNSVHYILDQDARPLDGLPGLYGPQAFQSWLNRVLVLHTQYQAAAREDRASLVQQYHEARLQSLADAWEADLQKLLPTQARRAIRSIEPVAQPVQRDVPPTAEEATRTAVPKADVEAPLIRQLTLTRDLPTTIDGLSDADWGSIAQLHAEDATLDKASIALMRTEAPAGAAGKLAISKRRVEDPLVRLVRNLQTSIAIDTVRNEYVLHRQLHQWFTTGQASPEINVLNEQVYAKLFLTPSSDPWLGLLPTDTYSGLTNNGIRVETKQ